MKSLLIFISASLLLCGASFAKNGKNAKNAKHGQISQASQESAVNENPVTVQFHMTPSQVSPGGQANITLDMDVAPDHHAYKDMMKFKWMGEQGVTIDSLKVSPLHDFMDPFSKKHREVVEGHATVTAIAHFGAAMAAGAHQGKIAFTYQACSSRYCLFPKTVNFDAPYTLVASTGQEKPAGTGGESSSGLGGTFQNALAKGKFMAFLFVFIGGFLTSLTPCVFPMIPITISIIGARSAQNQKSRAFALSLSYVLGIAFTYSLLGVIAASTGAFFGAALSNVWVVSFIAIIFLAMGMSMLGAFELQVPMALRNKFGNANTGTGLPGAFLGGLFAGLVASPCIGPVLVGILTYVAQTAQVVFGFFLLFTFAMGMGILFIVLGTFSGLLTKIPKAGPWMDTIKFIFGVTFIAMAYFYVYPHVSHNVFMVAVAIALFMITSYYGAFLPAPATPREQLKKGIMLAGFIAAVLMVTTVFIGTAGVSMGTRVVQSTGPANASSEVAASTGPALQWQPYVDRVIASIPQSHRPAIVDFYADWCVACHELEEKTYTDSAVISQGKNFELLKINATESTPEIEKLKAQYKVVGLPTVVFIGADGKVRDDLTVTGYVPPDDFLSRMNKDLGTDAH